MIAPLCMDESARADENSPMTEIRAAIAPTDMALVRELFREYVAEANAPACFTTFEDELRGLPGEYAPPQGRLFVAGVGGGCVALRRLDAGTAEIKRLYVRAAHRGAGLGRALAQAAIAAARETQARRVVLDTLPTMPEAQLLYRSLGFRETTPYLASPTPGALCFELPL
jgi:ribosomal protein S18 acetylase RimI-like enzyme